MTALECARRLAAQFVERRKGVLHRQPHEAELLRRPQDELFATALGMVELTQVVRSRILALIT